MMVLRRFFLSASVLVGLVAAAQTNAIPEGGVMTLEQCRQTALANNKNLRKSAQGIEAAKYQKKEAFAARAASE